MVKSTRTPAPAPQPDPTVAGPAAVEEADLLAASVARVEHRLRLLDELAEMATKLARDVTERGLAAKTAPADEALCALRAGKPAAGERNISQVRNYPRLRERK